MGHVVCAGSGNVEKKKRRKKKMGEKKMKREKWGLKREETEWVVL